MNIQRKTAILVTTIAILVMSAGVIYAQGNGKNNDNGGRGNQPSTLTCCIGEPQAHAYNYGGIGFANAETGEEWNDRVRGNVNGRGRGGNDDRGSNGTGFYAMLPPATEGDLPDVVVDAMIAGWTDEQQALAIYEAVIEQLGEVRPFVNIHRAELQHSSAWELMFDRYNIAVPEVPTFDNIPQFDSVADACQAAADAEIANFGLYDEMVATFSDYPDLSRVATALRDASEFNHLPAFESCASFG